MSAARFAYANARVRALKSQLLRREAVMAEVRGTGRPDPLAVERPHFQKLLDWYRMVVRSSPVGQQLCFALLRLHEVENLKLAWAAIVRATPAERWNRLWRPLGSFQAVTLEECAVCKSLPDLMARLKATPYGEIGAATLRAHANDLIAAQIALDRWASVALLSAAGDLPLRDRSARDLVRAVVRERDVEVVRRGVHTFGLSPDAVIAALVLLPTEASYDELVRLATWTPDQGSFARTWPRSWRRLVGAPGDWDTFVLELKRWRRDECRRTFLRWPYCLAPAIALLLLKEEEVRGVVSLVENAARPNTDMALMHALAAGALGQ
jgi:vacuolar-type H+-ATPase subunit C/Vma6